MSDDADLLAPLRLAVMGIAEVIVELDSWKQEPAVFTRRPMPEDAPARVCSIVGPIDVSDIDALNRSRPVEKYQVAFYGNKGKPGSAQDHTRGIERAAWAARKHFHRNRFSVQPTGYYVIDVQVRGPVTAPDDDEGTVGRVITLTVRLGSST